MPSISRILRGERQDIIVVVFYSLGIGLFSLVVPIAIQSLVNSVAFSSILQPILVLSLAVFVGLGISVVLELLQFVVVEHIQRRIYVRVSLDLARRIPQILAKLYKTRFTPQLVNRYLEVFSVQKSVFQILLEGVAVVLQITIALILLVFYHPFLMGVAVVIFGAVLFIYLVLSRGAVKTGIAESNAKHEVVAWLENVSSHPVLFKSTDGFAYALKRGDDISLGWLEARRAHFKFLLREKASSLIIYCLGNSVVLGVGGVLVLHEELSLGQLVGAEVAVSIVLTGINKFAKQVEYFYELCAAVTKLDSLSDLELEKGGRDSLPRTAQPIAVELKEVSAKRSSGKLLFENLSFNIKPGARVAISGANGSGKSKLADFLYGLSHPESGDILIDGHNVRDLNLWELRSQVILLRGIEFFDGTIEENLKLGNEAITGKELRDALQAVGLLQEISDLPEWLKTPLSTQGGAVSRGQALKLMLARAFLRKPRLIILDEALDGIDDEKLIKVFETLLTQEERWTLIVFTHEEHILSHFSEQYEIRKGTIRKI